MLQSILESGFLQASCGPEVQNYHVFSKNVHPVIDTPYPGIGAAEGSIIMLLRFDDDICAECFWHEMAWREIRKPQSQPSV